MNRSERRRLGRTPKAPTMAEHLAAQAASREAISDALEGWGRLTKAGAPGSPFVAPATVVHGFNADGHAITLVARIAVLPGHVEHRDADLEVAP